MVCWCGKFEGGLMVREVSGVVCWCRKFTPSAQGKRRRVSGAG